MGISFQSINTGLPKDIVDQIMNAEKIPLKKLEGQKAKIENKKKLLGELIGHIEEMRNVVKSNYDARGFRELKIETDNEVIDVTLDKNKARPGIYRFQVDKLAQKSSAITSGFADRKESYVGVGFIQYNLPNGDTKEVFVDAEHGSLDGVANIINQHPESGLKASVINDGSGSDTPWRIMISVDGTGEENKAQFPYFYFIDGEDDFYLEKERPAANAEVAFDGFPVKLPTNQANDMIPGVNIQLKKAKPGEEFSIKITEDLGAVAEKIKDLVEKINAVLKFINDQNRLDEKSDTSQSLGGDIILQMFQSKLRSLIFTPVSTDSGETRISQLGIAFQKTGLLEFDEKKFKNSLNEDFLAVTQAMIGRKDEEGRMVKGFLNRLKEMSDLSLQFPDGVFRTRQKGLRSKTDTIDRRIEQRQRLLEQKEETLKRRFSKLEETISRIRGQGAGLAALGQGVDPVQKLI